MKNKTGTVWFIHSFLEELNQHCLPLLPDYICLEGFLWVHGGISTESAQALNHLYFLKYSLYHDLSIAGFAVSAKSQITVGYKKCSQFSFFDLNAYMLYCKFRFGILWAVE